MNIYLLEQDENTGYDTYDSMVIVAENENDALYLSYDKCHYLKKLEFGESESNAIWRDYYTEESCSSICSWSKNPSIKLIAEDVGVEEGIICASFNAG